MSAHYRSFAARLAWALAALAGIALFASLGAWQWSRAQHKQTLLAQQAEVLSRRESRPLSIADQASRVRALDWAAGRGRFDARVLYLDNQQRGGRAGVRIYGVLQPDAAPTPLLVDLGWLPWGERRELPRIDLPSAPIEVAGVLAPPPSAGLALGDGLQPQGASRWLLTRLEPDALAPRNGLSVRLAPRVLRLDPDIGLGYERDFDLLANTLPPERHRGYAVQWFALAATVAIVYLTLSWRRRARTIS
jgi:surfeit locus 1 family protein